MNVHCRMLMWGLLAMCVWPVQAQELLYRPVNPNFGGNPLNGRFLLDQAILQDTTEDPEARARTLNNLAGRSSATSFAEQLDRSILSRLSRDIVANAFGEDGLEEGTFDTGVNTITVESNTNSTIITLVDNVTGETTTIEVPFF